MKKLLITILVLAVLALFMKVTVPQPEKHREAAQQKLNELVGQKLSSFEGIQSVVEGDDFDVKAWFNVALNQLEVKDYFVCNVGEITYEGDTFPLTVGVFNKVYVLTDYKDEIMKAGKKVEEYKKKLE